MFQKDSSSRIFLWGRMSAGMGQTYFLPPVSSRNASLALLRIEGSSTSCFPASARTFAAYIIPFRAGPLFHWAVICQEWAGVPGVTVAAEN